MNKHTLETLSKYTNFLLKEKDFCYVEDNLGVASHYNEIEGVEVYPILKTVDKLKLSNKSELKHGFTIWPHLDCWPRQGTGDGTPWIRPDFQIYDIKAALNVVFLELFLKDGYGAIPDKDSPTGYLSVHDYLPCKEWGTG